VQQGPLLNVTQVDGECGSGFMKFLPAGTEAACCDSFIEEDFGFLVTSYG
jgi:hypothetical protein